MRVLLKMKVEDLIYYNTFYFPQYLPNTMRILETSYCDITQLHVQPYVYISFKINIMLEKGIHFGKTLKRMWIVVHNFLSQ